MTNQSDDHPVTDYFYKSTDGLRLHCAVHSARRPGGRPVLCLPGLTRNGRDFATLAEHLHERHEVLALDLRGRGRSAWDPDWSHYQLPIYVQDAWTLLESRETAPVIVVGTSLGALMGLVMAAARPERIAGLVLNDAGPELDPAGIQRIAGYVGQLGAVANWTEAVAQAKSVYGNTLPGLSDAQWLAYAQRSYRENAQGVPVPDMDPRIADAFRNQNSAPVDLWAVFAQIVSVPLLVVRGALSDLLAPTTVARMACEKPGLKNVTVAQRGHAPLLDEPECIAAIDQFLSINGLESDRCSHAHATDG